MCETCKRLENPKLKQSINMLRLTLISALLILASARPNIKRRPMPDGRIVGGTAVDITEHPYQVSLQLGGNHICGGSIINSNTILTSAHCTDGTSVESLSVRVGSSTIHSGGTILNIAEIAQNPEYESIYLQNDSAVLKLDGEIDLSPDTQGTIPLADNVPAEGTSAICTGWGRIAEGAGYSTQLLKIEIPIISYQTCNEYYSVQGWEVTPNMICAGFYEGGIDTCQGDSGGPLAIGSGKRKQLVGIVSWGYGCARPKYPGVYTDVVSQRGWIDQYV